MNYVLDDKGNKIEAYSKEEVLSVLQQCIDDGSLSGIDAQSAFVSKLKCCVGGDTYPISFVTQAKYNELKENNQLVKNQLYFITDDMTEEVLEQNINDLWTETDNINKNIEKIVNGKIGDVNFSIKKLVYNNTTQERMVDYEFDESLNGSHLEIVLSNGDVFRVRVPESTMTAQTYYFLNTFNISGWSYYQISTSGGSITIEYKQDIIDFSNGTINKGSNVNTNGAYGSIEKIYQIIE